MGGHFSALLGVGQTAEWVSRKSNLKGKVAIVTGATSGIGFETARVLCKIGAKVYMGCRDSAEGELAKERMLAQLKPECVDRLIVGLMDLSSLETVKDFAEDFLAREDRLDFLVLNAGVFGVPKKFTKEGFEWHFGVNYLGHFYLTKLLFPFIIRKESPALGRIIFLTCKVWRGGKLRLHDLEFRSRNYSPLQAYSQSKLAVWLFVQELAERLKRDFQSDVCVFAVDPGSCDTQLFRNVPPMALFSMILSRLMMKNVGQGSATSVYACISNPLAKRSGAYIQNCHVQMVQKVKGHNRLRVELWEKAEELIDGMRFASYQKCSSGSARIVSGGLGMSSRSTKIKTTKPLWRKVLIKVLPAVQVPKKGEEVELVKKDE